jgi:hypothetical protein
LQGHTAADADPGVLTESVVMANAPTVQISSVRPTIKLARKG